MARKDNLQPTQERIMDTTSYFLMQIGNGVAIAVFAIGAGFIGALNIYQAFTAILIGIGVSALLRTYNGKAGIEYGIPFTVQLRSAFGFRGSQLAGLIRVLPALVWYGFQSWVGAEAINMILTVWLGFDNMVVCFALFQLIHIIATITGFEGIKWLENIGAVFILVALSYMSYQVINKYGASVSESVINIKGSWGIPFFSAIVVYAGNGMAVNCNMSDLSRNFKKGTKSWKTTLIYFLGLAPITIFMAIMGLIATGATGIADPVTIFVNVFNNKILLVITLLFVIFAQLTTNILSNALPVVYVLMDIFKISYKKSVVLSGIIPVLLFPWKLVTPESAYGLNLFIRISSAFLGPLVTIMVMDFYAIRKQKLNLDYLYDPNGPYQGINPAAIIAVIIGAIIGLTWIKISWLVSSVPTAMLYYVLMKNMPSAQPFWAGTVGHGTHSVIESD